MKINRFVFLAATFLSCNTYAQNIPGLAWNNYFSSLAIGAEYIDYDSLAGVNHLVYMHVCGAQGGIGSGATPPLRPEGGYMVGLHVQGNQLLCSKGTTGAGTISGTPDYSTMRAGMHACPIGTAMVGIHVGNNILRCAAPINGRQLLHGTERAAYWGDRRGMHACPVGWVMTGVHVNNNNFLCTATSGPGSELPPGGGGGGGGIPSH